MSGLAEDERVSSLAEGDQPDRRSESGRPTEGRHTITMDPLQQERMFPGDDYGSDAGEHASLASGPASAYARGSFRAGAGYKSPAEGNSDRSGTSKKVAIVAVVLAVLLAAVGITMVVMNQPGCSSGVKPSAGAQSRITVVTRVNGEGYDSETGTPIPVQIDGTDSAGGEVSEVQFVSSDGSGIQLPAGSYQFSFPASPINGDGTLYAMPADPIAVEVVAGSDGSGASSGSASDGSSSSGISGEADGSQSIVPEITLVPIAPADLTDEQIRKAEEYARQSDVDESRVDELTDKVKQARDDAQKQREAEEQAQREAEEQARREAEEQARREEEERQAREAIPVGSYSYVAGAGGYRGSITINGDGTASWVSMQAMRPDRYEESYQLESTGTTAPNGNMIYNMVPLSGSGSNHSVYYDPGAGGLNVDGTIFVSV